MQDGGIDPNLAGSIVATGGVLALLGKGAAWALGKRKGRITQLEARVDKLDDHVRAATRQVDCLAGVCIVLVDEVQTKIPNSPAIRQAKTMIGTEFPELYRRVFRVDPNIPPDMRDMLNRIDEAGQ